jgi:hypothetical protein
LRSCDTCPGGSECAGDNLVPVLAEIYALYAAGVTDKFDILFALSDDAEALFEKYNDQVSRICWTKGALDVIADILVPTNALGDDKNVSDERVRANLALSVKAFENFPWYVAGLVGQAPDLFEAICYRDQDGVFASQFSKRQFVKLCKDIVYQK